MSVEDRQKIIERLNYAVSLFVENVDPRLIPEVGTNIVFALPSAKDIEDVAGVVGRIVKMRATIHPVGAIEFGGSNHMARVVLTAMNFDSSIRSAANILFSEKIIVILDDLLFDICSFERTKEPPGIKTMDWGVASCCKNGVPDVIFDRGSQGKEPMIRLLGEDPVSVSQNIIKISNRCRNIELM